MKTPDEAVVQMKEESIVVYGENDLLASLIRQSSEMFASLDSQDLTTYHLVIDEYQASMGIGHRVFSLMI